MTPKKPPTRRQQLKALRQHLRARGIELVVERDNGLDAVGDMFGSQVCEHCGGRGSGLGVDHADDCLVPLAQAAEKAR